MKEFLKKIARSQRWMIRFYFEKKYFKKDPYLLETSDFGKRKLDQVNGIIQELPSENTQKVIEVGCGEGILANMAAEKFRDYLGVDISRTALKRAKERNQSHANLKFEANDFFQMNLEDGHYDLMIFSEVFFYFSLEELAPVPEKIEKALKADGVLLLVHCRANGGDDDSGTMVKAFGAKTIHDMFIDKDYYVLEQDLWDEEYRITVLRPKVQS